MAHDSFVRRNCPVRAEFFYSFTCVAHDSFIYLGIGWEGSSSLHASGTSSHLTDSGDGHDDDEVCVCVCVYACVCKCLCVRTCVCTQR